MNKVAAIPVELPPTADPDRKPVVLLTTQKAGSTIAHRILAALHEQIGVPAVNLAGMAWQQGRLPAAFLCENAALFDRPGYYFGALRTPHVAAVGWFRGQRAIVHVRDPRDCVVSAYFSITKAHATPPPGETRQQYIEGRDAVRKTSLDDFARGHAVEVASKMWMLHQIASQHPDYLISRYEDMVTDTERWLAGICAFLDIPLSARTLAALAPLLNFSVPKEQPDQMKRQVQPGDHIRKLTPESVADITETLADVMAAFGYPSSVAPSR